ncbi:MAG: DNA-3-methyladenine glycosylase family protein [Candidatus Bathyarchaeales archaeon]
MNIQLNSPLMFNLDFTLCCGQSFRWEKLGEWWYGIVRDKVFKVRQFNSELQFKGVDKDFVMEYFGLYDDLPKILSKIAKDKHIKEVVKAFKGLRILRQDPWECLISYICATYKNIPAIKQMLFKLSKRFGRKRVFDGHEFYTFPEPTVLAKANVADLAECGLGYRAKYVLETAKKVHNYDINLEELKGKSYMDARSELLSLSGVGLKVADCVLLFSLGKLEAFPVDAWVKRAVLRCYADHFEREFVEKISFKRSLSKSEYERLNFFGRSYFREYAGYAQEYIYHFERTKT